VDSPSFERFLVTGALGCVGAWTVKSLVDEGLTVVTFDRAGDPRRLRLIMEPSELERVTMVAGDITDLPAIERALDEHAITHVIHLAALQVPFVKSDPPTGAMVNVVGTVNVFEAVKRRRERIGRVVYAGSIGMFDAADADLGDGRLHEDAAAHPRTHYGVFKLANEGNARVYWQDDAFPSVALRPMTVYGPGRDQGLTSGPTRAILAALVGRPFEIGFGGRMLFQYAPDVARAFIAASRSQRPGALVYNLGGSLASIDEFIGAIDRAIPGAAGLVTHAPDPLPFPEEVESSSIGELGDIGVTPLEEAVADTVARFRARLQDGTLIPEEHGLT
jgi:UDP-glucuronate 4-epimerase